MHVSGSSGVGFFSWGEVSVQHVLGVVCGFLQGVLLQSAVWFGSRGCLYLGPALVGGEVG
jgi:hypothetical protein